MLIQNITCVSPCAAVIRPATIPPTSAPRTTVYNVPDVPLQPPKVKTDGVQKTSGGSSPQTRAEVGRTLPRADPGRSQVKTTTWRKTPGIILNPHLSKTETNKSITASASSISLTKAEALGKTQGTNLGPSRIHTNTIQNISGASLDLVKPDEAKLSNTIVKTPTAGISRTGSGKSNVPSDLDLVFCFRSDLRG